MLRKKREHSIAEQVEAPSPEPQPDLRYLQDHEDYRAQRQMFLDAEHDTARSFDQYLLTLSAGALGLSMTFVDHILPTKGTLGPFWKWLVLAWFSWGAGLILTLASLRISQHAHQKSRQIMEDAIRNWKPDFRQIVNRKISTAWWSWLIEPFSWISLILFVAGLVCLAMFIVKSLGGSK